MDGVLKLCCVLSAFALVCGQLPYPSTSSDVMITEGQSFQFKCYVSNNWARGDGNFVQVYKHEVVFPHLGAGSSSVPADHNGILLRVISTNLDLNPSIDASRYTISYDEEDNIVIDVTDSVSGDGGTWACRTTNEDSVSVEIDHRVSGTMANITIISPLLASRFIMAEDISDWKNALQTVDSQVQLNSSDPQRFGCEVFFYVGLPSIAGFWRDSTNTTEPVDMSVWKFENGVHSTIGINPDVTVSFNGSVMLTATTDDIPYLGNRDDLEFVCVVSVPLMEDVVLSIAVNADGPTMSPDTDSNVTEDSDHNTVPPTAASFLFVTAMASLVNILMGAH